MTNLRSCSFAVALLLILGSLGLAETRLEKIDIDPPHVSEDELIKIDYPIVFVRSPLWVMDGNRKHEARWAEFGHPFAVTPNSDLMILYPDGRERLLVEGGDGAIQDPYVSFDAQWVYYTKFHKADNGRNAEGADIYKVHVKTGKIVRLTHQEFAPNKEGSKPKYGVYNIHPCPVPGGKIVFVSNRNAYLPPPKSYPTVALQLHIMDEDGSNLETIGHLNLGCALHPVILKDGRIIFSSLENMGLRAGLLWGIWSIHPDGTNWGPVVSAYSGTAAPSAFHFQTQLSSGDIIIELYYNQNQKGFGTLFRLPSVVPDGQSAFGPGSLEDPRNPTWKLLGPTGGHRNFQLPFTPYGMNAITRWIQTGDQPAPPSDLSNPTSPRIGKVTHPCGAPDDHLLVAWTLGPIGGSAGAVREHMGPTPKDAGIYLIKKGETTHEPGEMRLIKNDPNYNESWPRPLVSYRRIHGVDQPKQLIHRNDGKASPHLPEGTPFGLVGVSSMYKRESAPLGAVPEGSVTAEAPRGVMRYGQLQDFSGTRWNWRGQGADAGRYSNEDIHAIRILAFEPNADSNGKGNFYGYPSYYSHGMERLRILGEIPVRKFAGSQAIRGRVSGGEEGSAPDSQPTDPDGNPDTSFLAKIPADVAFTFQTIDKDGMVLNMSQTWHQLRPGEVRYNCGGCHAHSQQPTLFEDTLAARPDYKIFDLTKHAALLTVKKNDESSQRWDSRDETGLRYEDRPHNVEFHRDIQPILARSCTACHTKQWREPAAGLVLDDDELAPADQRVRRPLPGSYARLAADQQANFGPKPLLARSQNHGWQQYLLTDNASRYVCKFQSRRSLLVWKIYGQRLDGWSNDDIETEELGLDDPRMKTLTWHGKPLPRIAHHLLKGDIDYTGSQMPPPSAIEGTYIGPDGQKIRVAPLTDEDRRTIVRWVDLGCPIDLHPEFDPSDSALANSGFLADDHRPTLALTFPASGTNPALSRILVGMHDHESELDMSQFQITANFEINGMAAGVNLAELFEALPDSRWQLTLTQPITRLEQGILEVSVRDCQGNVNRIVRSFSVR